MSLEKKRITDRTVPVPFTLILRNDETGEVETEEVCPKVRSLSYERWQQLFPNGVNSNGADPGKLARQLSEIVADWDMVDDGAPYQPSVEDLKAFDMPILSQYSEAILLFFVPDTNDLKKKQSPSSDS